MSTSKQILLSIIVEKKTDFFFSPGDFFWLIHQYLMVQIAKLPHEGSRVSGSNGMCSLKLNQNIKNICSFLLQAIKNQS